MLTYLDANVLIHAARGQDHSARRAFALLDDPSNKFAASVFLELELLPSSHGGQMRFYQTYLNNVSVWATDLPRITDLAKKEAVTHGIAAMDALHLAAAASVGARLATFEKPTKPVFRSQLTAIVSLGNPVPAP